MATFKYLVMAYRVLHCLASMNRGGAETFIMNVFRAIDREKVKFSFLLNTDHGAYIDEIKHLGGYIYIIRPRSEGVIAYCRNLDSFFKKHRNEFDAVHLHTSSLSSLEVLYYAKKNGITNRIIHSHNTVQRGLVHNIFHWVNKPIIKKLANKYLACSKVAAEWLYRYTGIYRQSFVVNNGIDVEKFSFNFKSRKEIRTLWEIAEQSVVIGHVGRFDEVKNHIFLLRIFKEYLNFNKDGFLMLVGVGPLQVCCEREAKELGIFERVKFVGLQTEVYKYLSAFDYFVFPSLYEGLPVALVEAQASGLTVVCSDRVSTEARLSDALTFLSLEESPYQWATYIHNLNLANREDIHRQIIESGYTIQNTVSFLMSEIYK